MISNLLQGTLDFVTSLLAATHNQGTQALEHRIN
jgi:hypothetical protein